MIYQQRSIWQCGLGFLFCFDWKETSQTLPSNPKKTLNQHFFFFFFLGYARRTREDFLTHQARTQPRACRCEGGCRVVPPGSGGVGTPFSLISQPHCVGGQSSLVPGQPGRRPAAHSTPCCAEQKALWLPTCAGDVSSSLLSFLLVNALSAQRVSQQRVPRSSPYL